MEYSLHNLSRPKGNKKSKKRVGRGKGSGKGTYSGRGLKGQKARSGGRQKLQRRSTFAQLLIRTPKKKGFNRASRLVQTVNLKDINKVFSDGDKITLRVLAKKGLIRKQTDLVKILAGGKLNKKVDITAHYFSAAAKEAIEKAGGKAEVVLK